jgi:hypothetical protein
MVTCWRARGRSSGPILLICSTIPAGAATVTRCNLSSWYVDPPFRAYAPLLVSHALGHKDVTYLNVSPAPHTRPIIEAQGFSRYCDGIFIAVPMVNQLFSRPKVKVFAAGLRPQLDLPQVDSPQVDQPQVDFDASDEEVLLQHAALGCVSYGASHPSGPIPSCSVRVW